MSDAVFGTVGWVVDRLSQFPREMPMAFAVAGIEGGLEVASCYYQHTPYGPPEKLWVDLEPDGTT